MKFILCLGFMVLSVSGVESIANINYADFSSTNGLTLLGNASQFRAGAEYWLELTPRQNVQKGAAWDNAQQSVQNGFHTTFTYFITEPADPPGDGFAFVIQNYNLNAIGDGGGNLGYNLPNSLAIEFDTYYNNGSEENGDTVNNHIAIQSLGPLTNTSVHGTGPTLGMWDSGSTRGLLGTHTVTIDYNPGTLRLYFDSTKVIDASVSLNSLLNLNNGNAWVGFTATTGGAEEYHFIENWSLATIPEPVTLSLVVLGGLALLQRKYI